MSLSRLVFALALVAGLLAAPRAGQCVSQDDRLFLAADAYYLGDFPKAAQAFGDVLESDPDNLYALSRLGASLAVLGRDTEALAAFEAVLAKRPDHLFARTFKGATLLRAGDAALAEAALSDVLRLAPDYPQALLLLTLARLAAGDKASALTHLAALARRDHPEAEVHAAAAALFAGLGLLDAAKLEWERALALNPNEPVWMTALGSLLARQGREKLAVTAFEQVLAMGGAMVSADAAAGGRARTYLAAAFAGLAWQAGLEGRDQDALGLCRMALRADPGQAGCLYLARAGGSPVKAAKDAAERDAAQRQQAAAQAADKQGIASTPQAPQAGQAGQNDPAGQGGKLSAASLAKLRSGPGAEHEVVMKIKPGTVLSVLSRQGDWTEVATPSGRRGFVRADLLTAATPE
jgi:tetratricopeptide (TPR) repeat protein